MLLAHFPNLGPPNPRYPSVRSCRWRDLAATIVSW